MKNHKRLFSIVIVFIFLASGGIALKNHTAKDIDVISYYGKHYRENPYLQSAVYYEKNIKDDSLMMYNIGVGKFYSLGKKRIIDLQPWGVYASHFFKGKRSPAYQNMVQLYIDNFRQQRTPELDHTNEIPLLLGKALNTYRRIEVYYFKKERSTSRWWQKNTRYERIADEDGMEVYQYKTQDLDLKAYFKDRHLSQIKAEGNVPIFSEFNSGKYLNGSILASFYPSDKNNKKGLITLKTLKVEFEEVGLKRVIELILENDALEKYFKDDRFRSFTNISDNPLVTNESWHPKIQSLFNTYISNEKGAVFEPEADSENQGYETRIYNGKKSSYYDYYEYFKTIKELNE